MSSYEQVLKGEGKVLLVGGESMGQYPQDLINDDRCLIWTDDIIGNSKFRPIPESVKALIISRAVNHANAHMLLKQARERNLFIPPGFNRSSNEARKIAREILKGAAVQVKIAEPIDEEIFDRQMKEAEIEGKEETTETPKTIAAKGSISQFVIQHANFKAPPTEEAKRLFDLTKQYGITTTISSLSQALYKRKRELGFSGTPESIARVQRKPESISKGLLRQIDDSIAAFQLLREHVDALAKENEELKEFKANIQKKLKDVFGGEL